MYQNYNNKVEVFIEQKHITEVSKDPTYKAKRKEEILTNVM
jgi:hypothetical protein